MSNRPNWKPVTRPVPQEVSTSGHVRAKDKDGVVRRYPVAPDRRPSAVKKQHQHQRGASDTGSHDATIAVRGGVYVDHDNYCEAESDTGKVVGMLNANHGVQTGWWKDQPDRIDLSKELADPAFIPVGQVSSRPSYSIQRDAEATRFAAFVVEGHAAQLLSDHYSDWDRGDLHEMCLRIEKGDQEALQDFADILRDVPRKLYYQCWRKLCLPGEPRKPRAKKRVVGSRQQRRRRSGA